MGPCCVPASTASRIRNLARHNGAPEAARRVVCTPHFTSLVMQAICHGPCRLVVQDGNEAYTDQVRLSDTRMAKLVTVPTSGTGLHGTLCPIGLRVPNGNDCHCEKGSNTVVGRSLAFLFWRSCGAVFVPFEEHAMRCRRGRRIRCMICDQV